MYPTCALRTSAAAKSHGLLTAPLWMVGLLVLTGCTSGPRMVDERYQPGIFNVTEIAFTSTDPKVMQDPDFQQAEVIIPKMLQKTLPDYPLYPPVTLLIDVRHAGEVTHEYPQYTYDENGQQHETRDVEKVTKYELDSSVQLLAADTQAPLATANVSHSVETDRVVETSSFRETLFNNLLSGPKKTVDLPEFYLAYTQKVLQRLYPKRKCSDC